MNRRRGIAPAEPVAPESAGKGEPMNWVVPILIVYLWFLVATPYNRFPILTDIRFERILVALGWLVAIGSGSLVLKIYKVNALMVALYFWMIVSWSFCEIKLFGLVKAWVDDYWKLMLFHFLFLFAVSRRRDLTTLFFAFGIICGFYQLHSMWDFVNGGAYVYQQGIKRIIGVWAERGGGSGNAHAVLALVTLPFAEFGYRTARRLWVRRMYLGFGALSIGSIFFSGTRAALVCAAVFGILHVRSTRAIFSGLAVALIFVLVVIPLLPEDLTSRYLGIFSSTESEDESRIEWIARRSGETRIEGLRDGFILATQRPLYGHGPGGSMWARFEINPTPFGDDRRMLLQLHNLYGQVLGDLGFVGAGLFLATVLAGFSGLRRCRRMAEQLADEVRRREFLVMAGTVRYSLILMLCYGMFAHTLYAHQWLLVFAFVGSLQFAIRAEQTPSPARRARPHAVERTRAESPAV